MSDQYLAAQETYRFSSVIKALQGKDFTRSTGSGIVITLTSLEGEPITAPFMIQAESMETIKVAIIDDIKEQLKLRECLRKSELAEIRKLLS